MAFEGTLQEFTVSMHGNTLEHTFIEVQQGDTASRKIRVHLKTFGGSDFLIPYGATAVLSVNKSDGHKILNECEIEDSSTVIITLTSQTIACPGMQLSQIYIFTDDWDIKTQKFYIHAPKAAYDGDAIKSTDEFGVLVETLNRVKQLEEDNERINEAEEERVAAFEERIEKMDQATGDANTAAGKANVAADKANAIADQIINDLTKRSNAIVQTASGESIVVNDASDDPLRGLRVFGKTEQFTTTGAQLFDVSASPYTAGNLNSFTFSDDGREIIAIGLNSRASIRWDLDVSAFAGKTVTLSGKVAKTVSESSLFVGLAMYAPSENSYANIANGSGGTKTVTIPGDITQIQMHVNVNDSNGALSELNTVTVTDLMLNTGSTALPYEPYTGGIASPNPQYPQELVSVGDDGDVEVGVYGKNLFDKNNAKYVIGISCEAQTLHFYANGNQNTRMYYMEAEPNTYYAISKTVGKNLRVCTCPEVPTDGGLITSINANTSENSCVVKTGINDRYIAFYLLWTSEIDSGITYESVIDTLMVAKGDTYVPYEPYHKQTLTALTPNGLPAIKVTDASLATYTDSDGQMWCCDEVDFERGVYVKRIDEVVLDETSTPTLDNTYGSALRFDFKNIKCLVRDNVGMCDSLCIGRITAPDLECFNIHGTVGHLIIQILSSRLATPDANGLLDYLATNPMTFQYILAEPIETPISDDELAQYQALHSNYPVTTVLNDEGVHMEVKYNADTSTYIAQNYVPKSAYTELEARVLALETNAVS